MIRRLVMWLYGASGLKPNRIIIILVVLGSLVIYEIGAFILRRIKKQRRVRE